MPKRTMRALLAQAISEGLPPATPALVVFNATRPDQAVVQATAHDLADRVEAAGLEGPAIVMVGDALGRGEREAVVTEALASAGHQR
jgi:uroporphyrin-III C-methyltransferase / precorrin-2 dehydrogenase / sirohydrochlorin ferrochelatase